jgi:DNA mismatch repair protein MutL
MALPKSGPAEEEKGRPRVLGQYLDMYIVAAGEEGLLVIDQHNAHERVLFERYKEIDVQKKWPRKTPLIPVLVDLSPPQVVSLEKNQPLLEEAGFRAEAMGGRTYALNGFPDIFEAEEARDVLLQLLDEIGEEESDRRREKILATLACKTAVKDGLPGGGTLPHLEPGAVSPRPADHRQDREGRDRKRVEAQSLSRCGITLLLDGAYLCASIIRSTA